MSRLDDLAAGSIGANRTFRDGVEVGPGQPADETAYGALTPEQEFDERGIRQTATVYSEDEVAQMEADLDSLQRREVVPAEEPQDLVPMHEEDGQLTVDDGSDASVSVRHTQLQDDEVEEETEGPLPPTASADEQRTAQFWGDRTFDRAVALGVPEEVAAQLAHQLVREDYVEAMRLRDEEDRAHAAECREILAEHLGENFPEALRLLSRLLDSLPNGRGEAILLARDPTTGRRMLNEPGLALFFMRAAALMADDEEASQITPDTAEEEAALEQLMNADIDEYRSGKWGNTGMTPADRALQLARRRAEARAE